eukprot:SAG11_NODE_5410_length_1569_cov_4.893878_1_plen_175_part_00
MGVPHDLSYMSRELFNADAEAEREQDPQVNSRNGKNAVSGCPHPAASVPTGQVDGSTPAAGHEDLLGSYGGAAEAEIEQNLEPGPQNAVEEWLNEAARASAHSSTSSSGDHSHAGTNQTLHSVQDDTGSRALSAQAVTMTREELRQMLGLAVAWAREQAAGRLFVDRVQQAGRG